SAADLWITRALAARSRRDAFHSRAMGLVAWKIGSISPYHTASGLHVVEGLIAQATGDVARYRAAVNRFVVAAAGHCVTRDLTLGRAGVLIGATLLLDARPSGSAEESASLSRLGNA